MTPFARIIAGGQDVTGGLEDRLLSIEVHDEAEDKSDRVTIELDDRPRASDGAIMAMPLIGQEVVVILGYREGLSAEFGPYLLDEIDVSSPPATLRVTGRSAAMPKSFRTPRSESYHQETLGAIIEKVAGRNGYQAAVDGALGGIVIRHIDQHNESDMAFASRLAGMHDAFARPVGGRLAVAQKGAGKSVSGQNLPGVEIRPTDCARWDFKYSAREEAGEAKGLEGGGSQSQAAASTPGTPPAGATVAPPGGRDLIIDLPE